MKNKALAIVMPLVVLGITLFGIPLFAGEAPAAGLPLKPGDRVRVWASTLPANAVGEVVDAESEVLRIQVPDRRESIEVPFNAVTRLERSLGTRRNIGKAALIGGLVGAGAGAAFVGIASGSEGCEGPCSGWVLVFSALGGGAGAIVGSGVGALHKTEHWEGVPVGRVGIRVVPERDGAGLKLSVRF
jgi:hypothetical protein